MKRSLSLVLALLALSSILVGCGDGSDSSSSSQNNSSNSLTPIKVGFLSSFTGHFSQSGYNGIVGVNLAVAEINASGGILGRQVIVVQGDDQSDPALAVTEMRRLVETEKIDALIGPINSQITLATISILNESKIPSISISGSSALTPALGPYHFSMLPSADTQAEAIASYLATTAHAQSVAIIYDHGDQAATTVIALERELAKRNIRLTGSEQYTIAQTEMLPHLEVLRNTNPDYLILLTGTGSDTGYILQDRQEMGWDIKIVGNLTVAKGAKSAAKISGVDSHNDVFALNYKGLTYCPDDALSVHNFSRFNNRLRAFDSEKYDSYSPLVVLLTYESTYALKGGLEGAKKINGPEFAMWMEAYASTLSSDVMYLALEASITSHFLIGPAELVMTENPDQLNSDGLMKRIGCLSSNPIAAD